MRKFLRKFTQPCTWLALVPTIILGVGLVLSERAQLPTGVMEFLIVLSGFFATWGVCCVPVPEDDYHCTRHEKEEC